MLNRHLQQVLLVMAVVIGFTTGAAAQDTPAGWPWRGINMNSLDSHPADIRKVQQQMGINSVHLQMMPGKLGQRDHLTPDQAWARSLNWVQAMLAACKDAHVVGIVELSGVPLKQMTRNAQTSATFWSSSTERHDYLARLGDLAKHLGQSGGEFAAYDIMSEPVVLNQGRGSRPPAWDTFQPEIVRTLRKGDPQRWIMVKPGPFGSPKGYRSFAPLPFPRLVYSVHMYDPHTFTHQGVKAKYPMGQTYPGRIGLVRWDRDALEKDLRPVVAFQRAHHVPIYVGEFSAVRWAPGAETYLRDLVSIFDDHGWGWAYFSFGGWNGWNPDYDANFPASPKDTGPQKVGLDSKRWKTLRALLPANNGR